MRVAFNAISSFQNKERVFMQCQLQGRYHPAAVSAQGGRAAAQRGSPAAQGGRAAGKWGRAAVAVLSSK